MRRRSLGTVADMPQDSKLGVAGSVPLTKLMALMYPNSPTIRTDMSKFAGAYNGLMAFVNKYIEPGHLPKATVNLLALTAVKGGAKNLTEVRQQSVALARKLIMGSTAERENVRKMIAHMKQLTEIAVARGGLSGRKGSTRQTPISPRFMQVVTAKAPRPMASKPMNSMSHQAFIMDHIQDGIQCANFWLKTLDRKRFAKEIVQLTQIRNELSSYLPAPSQMEKFPTISMKPSAPKIGRLPMLPPSMVIGGSVNVQKKNPLTPQSLYRIEQLIEQLQNLSMRLVQSEMKHLSMVNSQLQGSNKTVTSLKAKIAELETKCEKIANSKSPTESQRLTAKDVVIAKLKSEVASLKKMQSACKQSASVLKKDLRLAEFDLDNLITRDAHPQEIEAKHEEIEAIEKMITQVEDPILVVPEQGVSTTAASEEEEGGFFGDFFGDLGEGIDDIISGGKEIADTVTKTPEELADEEAALAEEEAARTAANTAGDTKETEEESNTMLYVGIGAVLLGGAAWYYTSRNN